ncbi:type IV secretion system protein [Cognatiyoonia sp. IB215182]|nr:type IV secretion system protein [Cognatiyoonia sp. IB215182]
MAAVFVATDATAQEVVETGDDIVTQLKLAVDTMGVRLSGIVIGILVTLLAVDIVLTFGRAVISGANLGEVVGPFVLRFAFVGVAWYFAQNAADIVQFLIETTLRIGQQVRGSETVEEPSVGNIMRDGSNYAMAALGEVSVWKPASIYNVMVAIIMVITSAIVAALLVLVYAEFYITAFAGLIVLAFAGTSSTKDAAVTYLRTMLGQALKLLGFLMTYAIMQEITVAILSADSVTLGFEQSMTAIMVQVLLVILLATIPTAMQNLAGGAAVSGASDGAARIASQATTTAGAAAVGAATGSVVGAAAGGTGAAIGSMRASASIGQAAGSVLKGAGSGTVSGSLKGARMGAGAAAATNPGSRYGNSVSRNTAAMIERLALKLDK